MYSKTKWYLKSVAVSYIYILIVADIRFLKGCVIFIYKIINGEKWNLQTSSAESNPIHFLEVRFILEGSKFDYTKLFSSRFGIVKWFKVRFSRTDLSSKVIEV